MGLRSIAASAGVTHAAIYRHFDGKEDLLRAIAAHDFADLVTRIRSGLPGEDSDPRRRLHVVLTEFVRCGLANPNLFEFLFWALPRESGAEIAATNDVFVLIHEAVAAAALCGGDPEGADRLTGFLLTACIGYVARSFVRPQTAHERLDEYVTFLLGEDSR